MLLKSPTCSIFSRLYSISIHQLNVSLHKWLLCKFQIFNWILNWRERVVKGGNRTELLNSFSSVTHEWVKLDISQHYNYALISDSSGWLQAATATDWLSRRMNTNRVSNFNFGICSLRVQQNLIWDLRVNPYFIISLCILI